MRLLVKPGINFPYMQAHLPDDEGCSLCGRVVAGENGWEIVDRELPDGYICWHCRRKHARFRLIGGRLLRRA